MLYRNPMRLRSPLILALSLAACLAARPGTVRAEDKPPPVAPPPAQDAPKPPDPRTLPEETKASRLAESQKRFEDLRRNQDQVQVRTRRNDVTYVGEMRYLPAAKYLKSVYDDDRDLTNRVAALIAIGKCGDPATIEYAVKNAIANAKKIPVLAATLPRMFASVDDPASREWIVTRLDGINDQDVLASVVDAVGEARQVSALDALQKYLDSRYDAAVRFEALRAIGRCGGRKSIPKLLPWLADKDWRMRMAAVEGLGFTGETEVIPDARKLIVRHEEPIVAETALEAVARIGTKDAIEPLIEGLKVGRLRARQKARTALKGLAQSLYGHEKDYGVDPNGWTGWWNKVKRGVDPDDPSFAEMETASYFNFPIHSDRVLFILDVSGSMNWPDAPRDSGIRPADWKERRIDIAHIELFKALKQLAEQNRGRIPKKAKPDDTSDLPYAPSEEGVEPPTLFNVATFSGGVMPWQKRSVLATDESVSSAIAWTEKQLPRGGTATYDALEYGIGQAEVDTVYFLSDGVPSSGRCQDRETLLAEVRKTNRFRRVSINTVALIIGISPIESVRKYEDPDDMAELMSRIASENQGRFANESKQ